MIYNIRGFREVSRDLYFVDNLKRFVSHIMNYLYVYTNVPTQMTYTMNSAAGQLWTANIYIHSYSSNDF